MQTRGRSAYAQVNTCLRGQLREKLDKLRPDERNVWITLRTDQKESIFCYEAGPKHRHSRYDVYEREITKEWNKVSHD